MHPNIKLIEDKKNWERFIQNHPGANFLQSYNWGLFQKKLNKKFFALGIFVKDNQEGAALVIKEKAKRGDYFTIAGGPLIDWQSSHASHLFKTLTIYLKELAKKENCYFIRVRPQAIENDNVKSIFTQAGLKPAPMHLTADLTLRLDLTLSSEQLLKQMRKNTRYEIKKGLKEGITTKIILDPGFVDEFYQHQLYLAKKHNFIPFSYKFLLYQFKAFAQDNQVAFVNSYYKKELLASAFVIFYHNEAVYHYGVSTKRNEKMPGSYVTQWAVIQEAKKRGCKIYNLWGVSPQDKPNHRFAGVSLFKRGFGGTEVQHLPAHDLAVSPLYAFTKVFEFVRKKNRGL